jgi:hypothetical protein
MQTSERKIFEKNSQCEGPVAEANWLVWRSMDRVWLGAGQ